MNTANRTTEPFAIAMVSTRYASATLRDSENARRGKVRLWYRSSDHDCLFRRSVVRLREGQTYFEDALADLAPQ